VYTSEFQCEVAFSFWGNVKNDEARLRLLEFLFCCMQPRMYMAGETLPGHFVEAVMIVKLDRLHIQRDAFANWIDAFFDMMRMSAGTSVFEQYLGEQMLTSMRRIQCSQKLRTNTFTEWNKDFMMLQKLRTNTFTEWNKDFMMLYTKLQNDRTEQEWVMSSTHNIRQILIRTVAPVSVASYMSRELQRSDGGRQREMLQREAPQAEAPQREAPQEEAPQAEAPQRGATERGAIKRGATERGAIKRGATERGAIKRGATENTGSHRIDRGKPYTGQQLCTSLGAAEDVHVHRATGTAPAKTAPTERAPTERLYIA
jgi:hypothetical protein